MLWQPKLKIILGYVVIYHSWKFSRKTILLTGVPNIHSLSQQHDILFRLRIRIQVHNPAVRPLSLLKDLLQSVHMVPDSIKSNGNLQYVTCSDFRITPSLCGKFGPLTAPTMGNHTSWTRKRSPKVVTGPYVIHFILFSHRLYHRWQVSFSVPWDEYTKALYWFLTQNTEFDFSSRRLIAIGHSMGAVCLYGFITCTLGSFIDGVVRTLTQTYPHGPRFEQFVLCEPMLVPPDLPVEHPLLSNASKFLTSTEKRQDIWPSSHHLRASLESKRGFQAWDRQVFDLYLVIYHPLLSLFFFFFLKIYYFPSPAEIRLSWTSNVGLSQ